MYGHKTVFSFCDTRYCTKTPLPWPHYHTFTAVVFLLTDLSFSWQNDCHTPFCESPTKPCQHPFFIVGMVSPIGSVMDKKSAVRCKTWNMYALNCETMIYNASRLRKIPYILQASFSDAFPWMKIYYLEDRFIKVCFQEPICRQATSQYRNQYGVIITGFCDIYLRAIS